MKLLLLSICLFSFQILISQEHAWVYFVDKPNVTNGISNPTTILTQRAIDRKNAYGIAVDARDVPVDESYISNLKTQTGITVKAKSKWFNCAHVIGSQTDINNLTSLAYVDYVEFADKSLNTSSKSTKVAKNHSSSKKMQTSIIFNYGSSEDQVTQIGVDDLHILDYTGEGVHIAVFDSGFDKVNTMGGFQRLRDNSDIMSGYDFITGNPDVYAYTGDDHGSRVLSTMGGFLQDQYVGTAPDATYLLYRTEDVATETPLELSYWVEAAERVDSLGVDIINSSLNYNNAFDNPAYNFTQADMDGNTTFISKGANIAIEKGLLVVSAAGNDGAESWGIIGAPGDSNALTIGSVDANGSYSSFSSRGPTADARVKPDVVARGSSTSIIIPSSNFNFTGIASGTSLSTPLISGAMACLKQALPNKTHLELMQLARESATLFSTPNIQLGYGLPDFGNILNNTTLTTQNFQNTDDFRVYPNPNHGEFHVLMPKLSTTAHFELYDVLGKQLLKKNLTPAQNFVSISHLNRGVYIAKITAGNLVRTIKIIKK